MKDIYFVSEWYTDEDLDLNYWYLMDEPVAFKSLEGAKKYIKNVLKYEYISDSVSGLYYETEVKIKFRKATITLNTLNE